MSEVVGRMWKELLSLNQTGISIEKRNARTFFVFGWQENLPRWKRKWFKEGTVGFACVPRETKCVLRCGGSAWAKVINDR